MLKGHTKKGDILITTRGEIGKIAFVPDNLIDVNINSQLVRINGNGILPRSFLACSLLSDRMTNEFKMLVSGSALQQLPVNKFKQMKLLMPDSETLNKFDSICSKIYDKIFINVAEINNLLLFLNTILPKLMIENIHSSTAKLSFIIIDKSYFDNKIFIETAFFTIFSISSWVADDTAVSDVIVAESMNVAMAPKFYIWAI